MARPSRVMGTTPRAYTPGQERLLRRVVFAVGRINIWLFRRTGGLVGGTLWPGLHVLLLTTTGRKSGLSRTVPLLHIRDGENLVVVASLGGSAKHPLWFTNLEANPDCEVEVGRQRRRMRARIASAEEKAALWPRLTRMYSPYDTYQARTTREIPVVILEPRGG